MCLLRGDRCWRRRRRGETKEERERKLREETDLRPLQLGGPSTQFTVFTVSKAQILILMRACSNAEWHTHAIPLMGRIEQDD
jgi:hypothetical protein